MVAFWRRWGFGSGGDAYQRRPPLVLVNGLAEQSESWFRNVRAWRRHFDVHTPALLAYEGPSLHGAIRAGQPVDIDSLVEKLRRYVDDYVETAPCHLLANSMGGKIAVEFALRHPEKVDRLVLLCPSGLADSERLPIVEGVRRSDVRSLIDSVFHNPRHADPRLLAYYQRQFTNKRWRLGMLRTIRGTMEHSVRERIGGVSHPTLLVVGREDRIVDPQQAIAAGSRLQNGRVVVLPRCGHAPQIEKAKVVNRLVMEFLGTKAPKPRIAAT